MNTDENIIINTDASNCDTSNCDASNCDASNCDASNCDASNCDASNCDTSNCDANNIASIQIIMNQTNYDFNTAKKKLLEYENDYIKVIKDYMNITDNKKTSKSINQQIFKEFRTFFES
tara:strand:- start:3783 stop:4139 length:357 start_codon:yes stop_codon:yes gene_type:complete